MAGPGVAGPGSAATASAGGQSGTGPMADGGTYRGLPRRVRQANLSPQLRTGFAATPRPGSIPAADQAGGRSPEDARSLAASLQSGWQRGRQAEETPDTRPADGTHTAGKPDHGAPHSEEA